MNLDTTYAGIYFLGVATGMVVLCIGWAWDAPPRPRRVRDRPPGATRPRRPEDPPDVVQPQGRPVGGAAMSREWEPGEVAMVAGTAESAGVRAIWQGNQWATSTGHYLNHWQVAARPLVVIDPEDREAVERLLLAYGVVDDPDNLSRCIPSMQAALREFADPKPPKPEEPMGLGAVVEDAKDCPWVRGDRLGVFCWTNGTEWRRWDEIDAVKVLSEGVR